MRKLGPMGESAFKNLCDRAGITCNKAHEDETGWDFFIEFPLVEELPVPIDMQPPSVSALVQVKATDRRAKSVQLKLTGLLRLINHRLPAFVVVFAFDGNQTPSAIFVVHIDETIIEAALKRIRTLEASGIRTLHRYKLSIPLLEKNKLVDVNELSLSRGIQDRVGRPFADYSRWKEDIVKKIGFGEEFGRGTFSIVAKEKDPLTELVDVMLGLKRDVDVSSFSMSSIRFGIEVEHPKIRERGKLSITPNPVGPCTMRFKDSLGEVVELDGKFYVPGIPELPAKYRKIRISSDLLDFAVLLGDVDDKVNFSIDLHLDNSCELGRLAKFFKTTAGLHSGSLELEVLAGSKPLFGGTIDRRNPDESGYWAYADKCAANLLAIDDKWKLELSLSPREFLDNLPAVRKIIGSCQNSVGKITVGLNFMADFEPRELEGARVGCIVPMQVCVKDSRVVLYRLHRGLISSMSRNKMEMVCESSEVLELSKFIGDEEGLLSEMSKRLSILSDRHQREFKCFFAMDPARALGQ